MSVDSQRGWRKHRDNPKMAPHRPASSLDRSVLSRAVADLRPFRRIIAPVTVIAAAWAVWVSGPSWTTPAVAVASVGGAALAVIDARTHRLPNALTYPTTVITGLALVAAAIVMDEMGTIGRAALGGLALTAGYLVLHAISPAGLGLGDVKLAALVGMLSAWHGWAVFWIAALAPVILGGFYAIALLLLRRASPRTAIAFGPFMVLGLALTLTGTRLLT
ncbi:MAG: prepilin peptidase [Beutenbergiaceae bacterium]